MEPIVLKGVCKDYIWGGTRLRTQFHKKSEADRIAESWELSCHPDGSSLVQSGSYAGCTLPEYLQKAGSACLGTACQAQGTLPVLIKLIDAKEDLSVQVHPDNAYAQRVEGQPGKTEMWYIVDCEEGASLLYGLNRTLTRQELAKHLQAGTLLEAARRVPVHKGDVFFIPAGTLHAIGKGILIAEIQQCSNVTYRLYDYGRLGTDGKPRPLHVEKALDVLTLSPLPMTRQYEPVPLAGGTLRRLADCDYFDASLLTVQTQVQQTVSQESFQHLLLLEGRGVLETQAGSLPVQPGSSLLLPAGLGTYALRGSCTAIVTSAGCSG